MRWLHHNMTTAFFVGSLLCSTVGVEVAGQQSQEVRVSGTVRYNGEPLRSRPVIFQSLDDQPSGQTQTNEAGEYTLRLQRPGNYIVTLHDMPFQRRPVEVRAGANDIDLDIDGGTIGVEVQGLASDVMVELRWGSSFSVQRLRAGARQVWEGLKFGEYLVSASGYRAANQVVRVELSESNKAASVMLPLGGNKSLIQVRDSDGNPVSGVEFPTLAARPAEVSAGLFRLDSVAPKAALVIRPPSGLTPTCQMARADGSREIVVGPSGPVTIVFEGIQPIQLGRDSGRIAGLDGSECAIPLNHFGILRTIPLDGGFQLELQNFPKTNQALRLSTAVGWREFVVGPDAIARVRF